MHGKRCPSPKNHTSIDSAGIKFASPTAQAACPNSPALPKDGPRIVLVAQCQLSENSPRGRRFPSPRAHETLTPQWKLKSSGSGFLQRCVRHPPWAHHQLGFGSGGYTGFAGTKPFRFGIWTFGRLWASKTSLSWMMPFR
jgi:hypothetical protein